MNIYLDIDGTLIGTKSPEEDTIELIEYILEHYPDSTYWLTTHCKYGENRCAEALRGHLPDDLIDRMDQIIQPTDWEALKTEAIDMDQDFVWFDDNLFDTERQILAAYYVLDDFCHMNPKNPNSAHQALTFLKSREAQANLATPLDTTI